MVLRHAKARHSHTHAKHVDIVINTNPVSQLPPLCTYVHHFNKGLKATNKTKTKITYREQSAGKTKVTFKLSRCKGL